jgi:hypothetical protein
MPITLTAGLNAKCCLCGIALYKEEIAYEIRGEFIDYIEHQPGHISVILCSGCRERLIHNTNICQGDAILKRKLLEAEGAKKPVPQIDVSEAGEAFLNEHPFGPDLPDGTGIGI